MSLNATPSADRVHIGIFGRRNAGKSSLMNAITNQNFAVVSDVKGTTTDPVSKAMELLPLGPVVMIDTAGLDDTGELGELRIKKTYQTLNKTDIALLVIDAEEYINAKDGFERIEKPLVERIKGKNIPYLIVLNKAELLQKAQKEEISNKLQEYGTLYFVSAKEKQGIDVLKEAIASSVPNDTMTGKLVGDLLETGDVAVLVVPIDSAAPKGRLILPQQQVIRDCLETGAIPVVTRETELKQTLAALVKKPKVVITDSQAFEKVDKETPKDIYLTSFSILFSRYKGNLTQQLEGARTLDTLKDGDKVLLAEGCTHHRQCGDIGTVKLPAWIRAYTGKEIEFCFSSGTEFPINFEEYALIIHCGGCTLNEREMKFRLECAKEVNIPMTNYGVAIAQMHGILERSVEIFKNF